MLATETSVRSSLPYLKSGRNEGAKVLIGGEQAHFDGALTGGYYVQSTIFEGNNSMRVFQEEIFGSVVSVAKSAVSMMR